MGLAGKLYDYFHELLTFDYVGDGLEFYGGDYMGGIFVIAEGTGGLPEYPATSPRNFKHPSSVEIISANQIEVKYSDTICGVAYNIETENCFPYDVNLCNSYGIPAPAFVDYIN